MADEEIKVRILAEADDFKSGAEAASSSLTASMEQMKSSVNNAGEGIKNSISQASEAASSAATNMSAAMEKSVSGISSSISGMKAAITGAAVGIIAVFGESTKAALDYEKSLLSLSRSTGLSIEKTSEMAFAAGQCGVSSEILNHNIGILARNMESAGTASEGNSNAFKKLNIDLKDSSGQLQATDKVLAQIADRFKSMPDGPQKTALAMQLFGRQGKDMIPFLNQGSAGLAELNKKAHELGVTFNDTSTLKAYIAAQRQWSATMKSLQIQIGNAVLPVVTALSKAITTMLQAFNKLSPEFRNTVVTIAAVAASLAALTIGWGAAAAAITAFGGPFAGIGTAMTSMPNIITTCTNALKALVVGLADGTMNLVKYIASGEAFTAIHRGMIAAVAAAKAALVGMRATVVAVSLAYQVGGVKSILAYCASLVTMQGIATVARAALVALYATVVAGIAVVVALATAWATNFGNIQEATAGTCDGIIYGLNTFADGVSQIMSGIGKIFVALADTIGNALSGDFSGAIDSAKGLLEGITSVGTGAWNVMKGTGQVLYGAASDPEGALNFGKAAIGAIGGGVKSLFGFDAPQTDFNTDSGNFDVGDFDGGGDLGGGSGGSGGGAGAGSGKGESEYEKQKKLFEQQLQLAEYTAAEKEALYKQYLANVEKSDKEEMDYKIGLYQLEKAAFEERLKDQEIDLENSHTQGKISESAYNAELLRIKKSNLDAEVDFRAKAALAADKITEADKTRDLKYYKEKVQAATWYKEALKDVLDAQKKYDDYRLSIENKLIEFENDQVTHSIALEEKRLDEQYNLGAISQEQYLAAQRNFENQRYAIQRDYAEKTLADNAISVSTMQENYEMYMSALSEADKKRYLDNMVANSKSEEATIAALKSLEDIYSQHCEKLLDISQKERSKQLQIIKSVRDTMADDMSSIMQDVAKGNKSILEGIRSLWSSTITSIIKQITNQLSSDIVQKAFKRFFTTPDKSSKVDTTAIAAEQATQAARTAAAQAGSTQRYVIEQNGSQMEVAATQQKAATQISVESNKNAVIVASDQSAAISGVAAIQASITAMLQMLPMLLILSALSGLFGGGSSTTTTDGPGINLGRSPDSYYKTPTITGIPSFDIGSWSIPADTIATVHQGELIIPAKGGQADAVRNMLSGSAQQAPNISLSYSAVHTGRTNADVRQEMKNNAKFMVKVLDAEYRKFNRGSKR